jgi:hypothetical protein
MLYLYIKINYFLNNLLCNNTNFIAFSKIFIGYFLYYFFFSYLSHIFLFISVVWAKFYYNWAGTWAVPRPNWLQYSGRWPSGPTPPTAHFSPPLTARDSPLPCIAGGDDSAATAGSGRFGRRRWHPVLPALRSFS